MNHDHETVLTYLDGYCERAGNPDFWAEPLNALTNFCFIVAAVFVLRALRQRPRHGWRTHGDSWLLVGMLFAIGVGSFLFHTMPNQHTVLMDVLPITAFINIYLIAALRRFFGFHWGVVVALWGLYFGFGLLAQVQLPPDLLNGTIMYIPTYLTLVLLTGALWLRHPALGRGLGAITAVWTLSLAFRTLDLEICEHFPIGTHFFWHALNAWVLYRLSCLLMAHTK